MKTRNLQSKRAFRVALLFLLLSVVGMTNAQTGNITFADANVKAICVANWDTNGDGELSYAEAAAVTDLGQVFMDNQDIHTFDELQYFTGLTFIGNDAFNYSLCLTSVVLPNTVTEIRSGAFYACPLTAITFPASVTSIGWASFYGCPLLSISLPASVTNIDGAFGANGNLESIIVEEGNTVYDSRDNCNAIIETSTNRLLLGCKNTVIPNTVVTIVGGALYNAQIETVTIPASVTDIQDNAFGSSLIEITVSESNPVYDSRDNCSAIIETSTNKLMVGSKTTVIPNTVTTIGDGALSYRYRDEPYNITIPESVTSIGENAFVGCNGIASLTVLAEVPPTLGNGAFSEVPKDIPVNVPCGTRSAYQAAEGWSEFTNIFEARITVTVNPANVGTVSGAGTYECGETCTLTATAYEGSTFINWTENNEVVSTEAEYTFTVAGDRTLVANFDGENIFSFADANVKALCVANWDTNGDGELSYAEAAAVTDLGQVFMDNGDIHTFDELQYFTGLTFIGENAFSYCGLNSVVLPNTVTEIRGGAFYACGGLLSITFSTSLTSIGYASFYASGLLSISLPASVTNINGFGANGNLESIIVEEGNTVYDSRDNCNAIIETSTNRLLLGCKNTVIPNTVVTIAGGALYYAQIETVTIPASVTDIQDNAFGSSLIGITVSESNPVYDSRDNCNAIIETSTNKLMVGSKTTVIPNTVTSIGRDAFSYRYRDEPYNITIPESVTSIGENAFVGCNGIASLTVLAEVPPTLGNGAFSEVPNNIPVYVPCGSKEVFEGTNYWNTFTNFIDMCPKEITVTANPTTGGIIMGAGTYDFGATASLTATANAGYLFINWTKDGEEVSTEPAYSFTVMEDASFVANFEPINVTQTSNFTSGWNWYSTYIEQEGIDGLAQLEESLGSSGIQIKSQQQYVNHYEGMGWMGMLSSINNESSYKIKTSAACVVEMVGTETTPTAHPIAIGPGWNWIGYPVNSSMSVATAFSNITPTNGDQVKAQNGYANYYEGMGWMGTLSTIEPGMGLLYKSNNNQTLTLVYPIGSKNEILTENITSGNNHWPTDIHAYPDNMTVTAVVELENVELTSESYELAAFANGECRGSVRLMYIEPVDRYMAFLTIMGEDVEALSFSLYDTTTGEEVHGASEQINFSNNATVGDLMEPYILHLRCLTGTDEWANNIRVFPNPVARGENVRLSTMDEIGEAQIEIINALGQVVDTQRATCLQTIAAPSVAGVYMLRVTAEGKGTCYRKLVVR